MRAHRVQREVDCGPARLAELTLGPVYAIGADRAGQRRVGPDQEAKSALFCQFCEDFGERAGFGRPEMPVDQPPSGRDHAGKIQRVGRARRVGEDQHRRQPGRQVRGGAACGAFQLAWWAGFQAYLHAMENKTLPEIAQRRTELLARLSDAADPPPVLVAVSKRQPEDKLEAALAAGQRVFGENRVQEAQAHWAARRELHLIGPLQTNKADEAVALFDVIETVDRPKLARALAKSIGKLGRTPRLLIQVNTGEEPQKAGVAPDELADLLALAREECGLEISGLMCIPPAEEPAAPHFALLKRLAARHGLATVSMGMSGDFELAARLGATHVRVGTGFFGARVEG